MSGGNSDASNAGVPWVVVLHKRRECSPARLCAEAQAEDAGRFSGNCFESYRRTINGMAVTVSTRGTLSRGGVATCGFVEMRMGSLVAQLRLCVLPCGMADGRGQPCGIRRGGQGVRAGGVA